MAINPSQVIDEASMDGIMNNTRVRASKFSTTFTDSIGATTLAPNFLGVNYIDGVGTPITNAPTTSVTLAARWLLTGVVVLQPTNATTATTDTAANILAACNAVTAGVQVGDYICVLLMNDSSFVLTMAMGSGVTSANAST